MKYYLLFTKKIFHYSNIRIIVEFDKSLILAHSSLERAPTGRPRGIFKVKKES